VKLSDFFSKWFFLSIILILIGLLLTSLEASHPSHGFFINLLSKLSESIGISILIANIFSFTIGTEQFLEYIRERLIKIVISKEFISRLSPDEQRGMLKMVLKPSKQFSDIYSGLNNYFDQYIEDSMALFDECYRGHMVLNAVASYNEEKKCVQIKFDSDYVLYKIASEFDPLLLWLENEKHEHIRTIVSAKGESEEIVGELITPLDKIEDPSMAKGYSMSVPERFNDLSNVNVSRRIIEYGNDHWQVFSFKTIKPCDQLTFSLRCEDDLIIKESNIYGVQDRFSIEKEEKHIKVTFTDWLSPGFGVNIVVAKPDFH